MGLKVENRLVPITTQYPEFIELSDGVDFEVEVVEEVAKAPVARDEFVYAVGDPRLTAYKSMTAFDVNQKIKTENRYDPESVYSQDRLGFYRRKLLA